MNLVIAFVLVSALGGDLVAESHEAGDTDCPPMIAAMQTSMSVAVRRERAGSTRRRLKAWPILSFLVRR